MDFLLAYTIDLVQIKGQELSAARKNKKLHIWALKIYALCILVSRIITLPFTWYSTGLKLSCHVVCKMLFNNRWPILNFCVPLIETKLLLIIEWWMKWSWWICWTWVWQDYTLAYNYHNSSFSPALPAFVDSLIDFFFLSFFFESFSGIIQCIRKYENSVSMCINKWKISTHTQMIIFKSILFSQSISEIHFSIIRTTQITNRY